MTILIFFLVLLVLVMVHEAGHFVAAKLSKMRVEEFAFGFPPKLFGKKIGETMYAFNLLPLGGYVKITGESFDPEENKKLKDDKRAFQNRPKILQLFVLFAGVFMNLILAFVLFVAINSSLSYVSAEDPVYGHLITNPKIIVTGVVKDSPVERAGLKSEDMILEMFTNKTKANLVSPENVVDFVNKNQESDINIVFKNKSNIISTSTVRAVYNIGDQKSDTKKIGLQVTHGGKVRLPFLDSVKRGAQETIDMTKLTIIGLVDVVKKIASGQSISNSVAGPVGIAKMVGTASENGWQNLFYLVAILSINLAIFNLLPIPALDGGRILFVLIEMVTRKSLALKFQYWANSIGFFLLIALMIFVTYKDLIK